MVVRGAFVNRSMINFKVNRRRAFKVRRNDFDGLVRLFDLFVRWFIFIVIVNNNENQVRE